MSGREKGRHPREIRYSDQCADRSEPASSSGNLLALMHRMNANMERMAMSIQDQEAGSLDNAIPISKGFNGITVPVEANATHIVTPNKRQAYLIVNPDLILSSRATALVSHKFENVEFFEFFELDVEGTDELHLFFGFTSTTFAGDWSLWLNVWGGSDLGWIRYQKLMDTTDPDFDVSEEKYAFIGSAGVAKRVQIELLGTPTLTLNEFVVSYYRKKNIKGLDIVSGVSNVVFIGNAGVTTTSGYPLLPGQEKFIVLDQNVALYGVATSGDFFQAINIKLFKLDS